MKTKMLSLTAMLFLFFLSKGLTQQDWQFVPDKTRYVERQHYRGQMSFPGSHEYYDYLIDGDTIFENNNYQIVKGRNLAFYDFDIGEYEDSSTDYLKIGAIRRDTTKVFFRSFGPIASEFYFSTPVNAYPANQDQMIFDFSIGQGDTVSWKTGFTTVIAQDTIMLLNGEETIRNVFWVMEGFYHHDDFWMEGVGGIKGLLGAITPHPPLFGPHHILACIHNTQSGETIFAQHENFVSWCSSFSTDTEEDLMERTISVYPNPTDGPINIEFQHPWEEVLSIELLDLNGRIIHKKIVDESIEELYQIRLQQGIQAGGYYVKITLKNGDLYGKQVIVTN